MKWLVVIILALNTITVKTQIQEPVKWRITVESADNDTITILRRAEIDSGQSDTGSCKWSGAHFFFLSATRRYYPDWGD
ncbi:MAG: hypothetical protein KFF73_02745 [Cyclobacteriaceae bacterium]|nr:hypothetical protein [Cyclobacteriaceae bacterium]